MDIEIGVQHFWIYTHRASMSNPGFSPVSILWVFQTHLRQDFNASLLVGWDSLPHEFVFDLVPSVVLAL